MITLILTGCGIKKDLSTKDFIIIIANGSAQEVKDAVKNRGCDAALFWSTAYNRIEGAKEKVQILLDNDFDPNMRCKNGLNAIEWIDKFPTDVNQDAYLLIKQHTK